MIANDPSVSPGSIRPDAYTAAGALTIRRDNPSEAGDRSTLPPGNSATYGAKEIPVPLDVDTLKAERDKLKEGLRELEAEQRKIEAELKTLRQREIQRKREIEALGVLIEIHDDGAEKK
jgi:hypothetical protein